MVGRREHSLHCGMVDHVPQVLRSLVEVLNPSNTSPYKLLEILACPTCLAILITEVMSQSYRHSKFR